jgi:hypothetical protein
MTDLEKWLAIREEAGLHIDPRTAEVEWTVRDIGDPHGIDTNPPVGCFVREYFARSPGSGVWVWFGDLPEETEKALWEKYHTKHAFAAGLEDIPQ